LAKKAGKTSGQVQVPKMLSSVEFMIEFKKPINEFDIRMEKLAQSLSNVIKRWNRKHFAGSNLKQIVVKENPVE
jgi:hypothetical protein